MPFFSSSYQKVRDQKLAQRRAAIAAAETALATIPVSKDADEILKSPAYAIADKIKAREWTTLEVVATFARRCIETHHDINCLTEGTVHTILVSSPGINVY